MPLKLICIKEVCARTSLSRATIYRRLEDIKLIATLDEKERRRQQKLIFPLPVSLGGNRIAWREDEIDEWILTRSRTENIDSVLSALKAEEEQDAKEAAQEAAKKAKR